VLAQKLIVSYSTKIGLQLLQVAASIVVARIAGPTVLGTVSFGLAYVTMFSIFSELALGSAHIKIVSEGQDLGKCIATYSRLKLFTSALYFVVTLSFFLTQKYLLGVEFESVTHQYVILIYLVMVTLQSFLKIPYMTFAGRTEQAKQDLPEFIRSFFYQISRIVIVILGYRALTLAFSNLLSFIFIVPLVWYLFRNYPFGEYDKELAKRYFRIALPLMLVGLSSSLMRTLDKVLLQFYTNSEQVGYYSASYRIGNFLLIIATSVGMLFFPLFSRAFAGGDLNYIKKKIEKFERFSFFFIMPGVIFLAIYSDSIVHFILGEKYAPSIPVLSIITVAMFIMVINMPYGNVITGMNFFKLAAKLNLLNILLFIPILVVLVNPGLLGLSAAGAALSILISNIFLGVLFRFHAKKMLDILNIGGAVRFVLFGVMNFMLFYALYSFLKNEWGTWFRLVFPFIYFLATYSAYILLGWITKKDWQMLLELVNIKAIKDYIGSEISD